MKEALLGEPIELDNRPRRSIQRIAHKAKVVDATVAGAMIASARVMQNMNASSPPTK
ncbi:MAG: hypothetical protein WCF68_20040 [Terriglobales bacterium]